MWRRPSCNVQLISSTSKHLPKVKTQRNPPVSLYTSQVSTTTSSTPTIGMTSSLKSSIITGIWRRSICRFMRSKIVLTSLRQKRRIFRKIERCSPWRIQDKGMRTFTQRKLVHNKRPTHRKRIHKIFIKLSCRRLMPSSPEDQWPFIREDWKKMNNLQVWIRSKSRKLLARVVSVRCFSCRKRTPRLYLQWNRSERMSFWSTIRLNPLCSRKIFYRKLIIRSSSAWILCSRLTSKFSSWWSSWEAVSFLCILERQGSSERKELSFIVWV